MRILMEVFRWGESKKEEWEQDSRVGLKVSVVDCLDQLLRDLYDLLLASCGAETKGIDGDGGTRWSPLQAPLVPLTQSHPQFTEAAGTHL